MTNSNGWDNWGKHVLAELERLNKNIEALSVANQKFQVWTTKEIATLRVKAGVWGLIGGAIPIIIVLLTNHLSK